VEASQGLFVL